MRTKKILDTYLKEISNGDKEALSNLFMETKTAVYSYILSIVKNKFWAEEIMQDTYVSIYQNANLYKNYGKPLAWILTIAKNNSLLKLKSEKNNLDCDTYKEKIGKEDDYIVDEMFLNYLFHDIQKTDREIILLHAVAGFRHREIAEYLQLPLGTVLSKYKRTINKLKEKYKEDII